MNTEEQVWVKVPEAAAYFGIPRSRLYELIQKGEFLAVRVSERCLRVNIRQAEEFLFQERSVARS